MQLVSKPWKAALESPDAHSLATLDEDELLPYTGHVPDRREGHGGHSALFIHPSIVKVLKHCNLGTVPRGAFHSLAWLPVDLESLKCTLVSLDYPKLLKLKRLQVKVQGPSYQDIYDNCTSALPVGTGPFLLHVKFPNLEWLDWESQTYVQFINVEALHHLRFLKVFLWEQPEDNYDERRGMADLKLGRIPSDCRLEYTIAASDGSLEKFPLGMAEQVHLFRVTVFIPNEQDIDLGGYAPCINMEVLIFQAAFGSSKFEFTGLNDLPAACNTVIVEEGGNVWVGGEFRGWDVDTNTQKLWIAHRRN